MQAMKAKAAMKTMKAKAAMKCDDDTEGQGCHEGDERLASMKAKAA